MKRALAFAFGSWAVLSAAPCALFAAPPQVDPKEQALQLLGPALSRVDFILLLDTSEAMAKHFDEAKILATELAARSRPGDTLSFITFRDRAGALPAIGLGPGSADRVKARLSQLRAPVGDKSDLGAGLEAVLDALLRPDAAPLAMVFLFTDFCARPLAQSPYMGEPDGGGPCRRVTLGEQTPAKSQQVLGAAAVRTVRVFALPIEPANEAGLAAARDLLGSVERAEPSSAKGDLRAAIESLKRRMPQDRGRLQLEQILGRPPLKLVFDRDELPLQGESTLQLTLLGASPLPMTVDVHGLKAADGSVMFEITTPLRPIEVRPQKPGPETKRWEPIEGATFEVKAKNVAPKSQSWSPSNPKREIDLELLLSYSLSPSEPFEKLLGRAPVSNASLRQPIAFAFAPPPTAGSVPPVSIAVDAKSRLLAIGPGDSADVPIVLSSSVTWAKIAASCNIGGKDHGVVEIDPGGSVSLNTRVVNDSKPRTWRLLATERREVRVTGSCDIVAIAADGARIPRGQQAVFAPVILSWNEGVSPVLVLAITLALLAALVIYVREVRPRLEPAALSGQLVIYEGPGSAPFHRVELPLKGHARIQLDGVPKTAAEQARLDGDRIVLPGSEGTSAEIYAEKIGKESVMRLRRIQGERVMFGGSRIGAAPVDLKRGRTRFSIGDYHCRIE